MTLPLLPELLLTPWLLRLILATAMQRPSGREQEQQRGSERGLSYGAARHPERSVGRGCLREVRLHFEGMAIPALLEGRL
jgi:hypothetical protein